MVEKQISNKPLQLKLPDISMAAIDPVAPWKDDLMRRSESATHLSNMLAGQDGPLTVCIDSEWGTGKTFFLRRFKSQWEIEGGRALYFNAWEDDFLEDPLVALIGQIWGMLKGGTFEEVGKAIRSCGFGLVKKAALHKLGVDSLDVETSSESAFDEYLKLSSRRSDLRSRLSEMSINIFRDTGRPLLFIVDELDRCRPSFSIELLERIKHIFPIEHMIFLLGVDCSQLKKSLCAVYGDIDPENYLHRFIDVPMRLPKVRAEDYLHSLLSRQGLSRRLAERESVLSVDRFDDAFCSLLKHYKMSFREMEIAVRLYSLLALCRSTSVAKAVIFSGIAVVLKMKNPEVYKHYIAWDIPIGTLIDMIYGDFSDVSTLTCSNSEVEFMIYLYEQAWFGEQNTVQCAEVNRIFCAVENGEKVDLHSPYVAECFRRRDISELQSCIRWMRGIGGRNMGYAGFKEVLVKIDEYLGQIADIKM